MFYLFYDIFALPCATHLSQTLNILFYTYELILNAWYLKIIIISMFYY